MDILLKYFKVLYFTNLVCTTKFLKYKFPENFQLYQYFLVGGAKWAWFKNPLAMLPLSVTLILMYKRTIIFFVPATFSSLSMSLPMHGHYWVKPPISRRSAFILALIEQTAQLVIYSCQCKPFPHSTPGAKFLTHRC